MNNLYRIIKGDYLQRSRSYAFLITLAITIYAAYHFVPGPDANYTTLTIPGFKGAYNSVWAGHVTTLMTLVVLSLFGFPLINGAIKKDITTEVGLIIATTQISNLRYLLIKLANNFLILLTLSGLALLVGIGMFFIQKTNYPFHILDFLLPYLFMVVPAIFLISALAIVAEVFLSRQTILQFVIYFFIFNILIINAFLINSTNRNGSMVKNMVDGYGMGIMVTSIKQEINNQFNEKPLGVSLGYSTVEEKNFRTFVWHGVSWDAPYLLSRLIWMGIAFAMVYFSSFFFHRFDFKSSLFAFRTLPQHYFTATRTSNMPHFSKAALPPVAQAFGILPLVKTELMLMVRKGSKWLWLLNAGLWIATLFAPLTVAYVYLLPILFFLQVSRVADLVTRDQTYRLHYFTYSSYQPLQRILPAQLLAGLGLLLALAIPVIFRLLFAANFLAIGQLINGALFILSLSIGLGVISGGKKLFEIFFLLLTYIALQAPNAHYLGSIGHANQGQTLVFVGMANLVLLTSSFAFKSWQLRHQ